MSTYVGFIPLGSIIFLVLLYKILLLFQTKFFDKYFQLHLEEKYNLDHLFQIKLIGTIVPKVDFLDIPYKNLNIEINTKTIRGTINNNIIFLEFIRPKDRKTSTYLIKSHYIKAVKPHISETIKNKKDYIRLIKMSKKQKNKMEKIACQTCKNKVQCQISFTECNYERQVKDVILHKGIKVDNNKNYEL